MIFRMFKMKSGERNNFNGKVRILEALNLFCTRIEN